MFDQGWGNGYVCIPFYNPYFGVDYNIINNLVEVHGGLTFGELGNDLEHWKEMPKECKNKNWYVIGFDTCHYGDNMYNASKEYVLAETKRLLEQLETFR